LKKDKVRVMKEPFDNNEEIIPITESDFRKFNDIRTQIFTEKTLGDMDNIIKKVPFENVDKIFKKIDILIKEELKTKNTDSISAVLGLYACFLSYYNLLLDVINELEEKEKI
jgi:hypothetical protein